MDSTFGPVFLNMPPKALHFYTGGYLSTIPLGGKVTILERRSPFLLVAIVPSLKAKKYGVLRFAPHTLIVVGL